MRHCMYKGSTIQLATFCSIHGDQMIAYLENKVGITPSPK